jgi:hypothetical protein
MRLPRVFEMSIELPPEPEFGVFAATAGGPGWTMVPHCSMEQQKCSEWCWAAAGQCIERTFGTSNPEQCAMVQKLIAAPCCIEKCSATCNKPKELQSLLSILNHFAGSDGRLEFPQVVTQIKAKRPVCCFIARGSNNHFLVISGVHEASKKIALLDPVYGGPAQEYDFSAFRVRYEDGTWTKSFLTH